MFYTQKKSSYIRFGGAMRRRRAARGAGSLVRDAPPGLGARAGPGRGATPWRGTVCAVLKQGFPVCQPAGSRFSSDFPVVQQGPPLLGLGIHRISPFRNGKISFRNGVFGLEIYCAPGQNRLGTGSFLF